jgi:DNA-binding MarR family transcriptional regulator
VVWILKSRKLLKYNLIVIALLIVSTSLMGISLSESIVEPHLISISTEESLIAWEFDDASNYLINNTIIKNGIVQLDTTTSFWRQSSEVDYSNGKTQNITIIEDGSLKLSYNREELAIDVKTDRSDTTSIHHEQAGYQTFRFNETIILTKIIFLAKLNDDVSSPLNVSIETENNETLDFRSLLPSNFSSEINEIIVNFSCIIKANTTYHIKFESAEDDGSYKLISDSDSDYSEGYFQELELNDDDDTPDEPDDEDIEFQIYTLRYSTTGMFESEIYVLDSPVIWSDLQWIGKNITNHKEIKVQVRCGNTSKPQDTSWTKWMDINENNQLENNLLTIPPSKCIQYKIILSTINPYQTPTFESINISYQRYYPVGSIETLDFETDQLSLWLNFSAGANYQEQDMEFYFSLDSGSQWSIINTDNKFIDLKYHSKKIRFLVKFNSKNTTISPTLDKISLGFTKFNPETETETGTGNGNDNRIDDKDQDTENGLMDTRPGSEHQIVPKQPSSEPQIVPMGTILTLGIFAGLFSVIGWGVGTETGKYTIIKRLLFFIIPLYYKIDRDKVLDHYLRNQIYKYIQTNPGTSYSEIMKDTDVKNGVLVHHLKTLDREGLIKSIRDGMFRRFYPEGVAIPKKEIETLSWFQIRIFNFIRMNPGTTPKEIANEVGKSKQVVNYHLKLMKNAALVRAEELGKHTQLYVTYSESE